MSVVRVKVTIEPRWTHEGFSTVIEIDEDELEGLDPAERAAEIQRIAEDTVNDECPWGFQELEPGEEQEGDGA